ncbi:MAG: bifunctional UDP-N-acetylglucosamine diphosphorylase/glucosamine-1-phosphate N-acetyltransferase GlmU [Desulfohalobiaceae bacterium]|nr:bifunctional UDP-N-acetylglucosamine diphosphorylase/glucosamine-1-phosphate N-acetyltransferase GlmU [Desulfohalobiaceae bacterium]
MDPPARTAGLVLAGGQGKRMGSAGPKVLMRLLGEPMLYYIYQALASVIPEEAIWTVVGHKREHVEEAFPQYAARFIHQQSQLGTGHALLCAHPHLQESGVTHCLVVNGDVPLLSNRALLELKRQGLSRQADVAFLTMRPSDPTGYGRVLRGEQGFVERIVEEKDLHPSQGHVDEVNAGIYWIDLQRTAPYLERMDQDNAQGEYYLPQLVELVAADGGRAAAVCDEEGGRELLGVNRPQELVRNEEQLRRRIVDYWLDRDVILRNPDQARIGPRAQLEPGCELTGPLEIYGASRIEAWARVDSHVLIADSAIGEEAWIRNFSHLEGAEVMRSARVGPYARLRQAAVLEPESRAGNFVEVKKAVLGPGSKANHLAYIGDASVGSGANIGAGCITCNYDGRAKHRTTIGDGAFIGSNTSLVAPLEIGARAVVGAGSTISKSVPEAFLAVARARQRNLERKVSKREKDDGNTGQTGRKDS